MAINTLAYATLFMQELDKQVVAKASTGWMEGNAGQFIYNGGNTVKLPKITMDGLANYNRSTGFVAGGSNLAYETFTMSQDRGRTFSLDAMDVNETNFVANASNLMGEFQRTMVIPEIDAYRLSTIATKAISSGQAVGGYTPDKTTIYSALKADIAAIQDVVGADIPLVITMSTMTLNTLESSTEMQRFIQVGCQQGLTSCGFTGNVDTEFKSIDGNVIIETPSARLKTAYVFNDGVTAGQTQGGYAPYAPASLTLGGVKYTASTVGTAGNAYSVTIVQGSGASVATAGVIDASGNLVITLGTTSGSAPLTVTATQIAALTFTGAGSALITATAVTGTTVQVVSALKNLANGAGSGSAAKNINWIITAQNAPVAISKTDTMRIFDPSINQSADAWKLDYRKYHDLWIPDNKMATVFVNVKETL